MIQANVTIVGTPGIVNSICQSVSYSVVNNCIEEMSDCVLKDERTSVRGCLLNKYSSCFASIHIIRNDINISGTVAVSTANTEPHVLPICSFKHVYFREEMKKIHEPQYKVQNALI